MKLGDNIKRYRQRFSISQEDLANRIYVTRQTVSNWENQKSYPDINSLILLAESFDTTVDNLIKGDLEDMKKIIEKDTIDNFSKLSLLFSIMFILTIATPIPLFHFFGRLGIITYIIICIFSFYIAFRVDKIKREYDLHTYKEILAFTEGKRLDEISKAKEEGKRIYQKIFLMILSAILAGLIGILFIHLLK